MKTYDLTIIGSGPAGLSAAIYASRYNLNTLVLGAQQGGLIADAHKVCNFPTRPEIEGSKLGEKMQDHAEKYGAEVKMEKVTEIKENDNFVLKTNLDEEYEAKSLMLATGTERRKLGLDREEELMGAGVSYCATCDGRFFEDQVVGVVGGANAAATAALYLADLAKKVYIIYRRDELRAVGAWKEQIDKTDNIEVVYNTNVTKLKGEDSLQAVQLDQDYEGSDQLELEGLFVEIGSDPRTELSEMLGLELDKKDYIKVDETQKTSKEKVWAAGDITTNSNYFKQSITASAEGAVAANSIHKFIKSN
ncbi:MAG: FAD-dependent oxidoreductase [Candidatus Paceibacterota bacterium]